MAATVVQTAISVMENESFQSQYMNVAAYRIMQCLNFRQSFSGKISTLGVKAALISRESFQTKKSSWRIAFALNTGGAPDSGGQDGVSGNDTGLGQTRLGRIVGASGRQLLEKLNATRKNFPMKIFLLLLGFYTANALATILGQTGDWDVLVAGVVVAAIEGIGMLMYRKRFAGSSERFKSVVVMVNYWKAGVCLGLFVDAFKLGS